MRITIVGAGPLGNYAAWKLTEKGYDVHIYEEHTEIGKPVQCTGIVTKSLRDLVPIDPSFFVNQLEAVDVFAPNGDHFRVPVEDFVICRTSFDQFLGRKAVDAGATLHTGCKLLRLEKGKLVLQRKTAKNKEEFVVDTDILIGADGPNSVVSKTLNGGIECYNYFGAQATVKRKCDPNVYQVYLGDIVPEYFGWVVPENGGLSRVGLAVKKGKGTATYFKQFLSYLKIMDLEITDHQGGLIPVYIPQLKIEGEIDGLQTYLLGDAATQIKSTTGGGLVPSLQAANILIESIVSGKKYSKLLKKSSLYRKLWLHLIIRRVLDLFSDVDYNGLVQILKKESVIRVLGEVDRDQPVKLLWFLLLRNPLLPFRLCWLFFQKKFFIGARQFVKDVW